MTPRHRVDTPRRTHGRRMPLTISVAVAVGCAATVWLGALGPRRADAEGGGGRVDGDEIIAEIDDPGRDGGGDGTAPNPDRCSWTSVTQIDPVTGRRQPVTRRLGSKTQVLMSFECAGPPPRSGRKWITRRNESGSGSSARRKLPAPDVSTAPRADMGVVNVGTWFWVSRAVWKPWSVTASVATPAGPVTVTTTARPSRLVLDPGDGSRPVACSGPGLAWTPAFGDRTPTSCMHVWRNASTAAPAGVYRAKLTIVWKVTWRSSLGVSGRLPDVRTSTPFLARVREIQAVAAR